MGESVLNVNLVLDNRTIAVPYNNSTIAEDVCIHICKQLNIGPLTRHLFALRVTGKSIFLMPSAKFGDNYCNKITTVDFRIRFKVADIPKLANLDMNTYNYYFHQARNDVLENRIPDIIYEKYRKALVGLGITDMYRVMLEKDIPRGSVENDYKKYIPKEVLKRHPFFIKKPIHDFLGKLQKSVSDPLYVKAEYLRQLKIIAPEYLSETYKAITNIDGDDCSVILKLSPYDPIKPGLKYYVESKKDQEGQLICTIEEINVISINNNGSIEIFRHNGVPFYLTFHSKAVIYSFISLLDGYYRLTCKWIFNICKEVDTPSLRKLHAMKSHGPVGGEFSYAKLEAKCANQAGYFIIRESESKYNHYYIDVCVKNGVIPKTFKLEKITGDEFIFNDDLTRYKSIHQLMAAYNDPNGAIYLHKCLPPTEYDDSPLLLCKSENMMGDSLTDSSALKILMPSSPVCINCKDLQVYKGQKKEGSSGITVVFKSMWKVAKGKKIQVAMKMLKEESADRYLKDMLTLAGKWAFLPTYALARLYGIAFTSNISLVLEYFPLGPLDQYLRENRGILKTVDLMQAACNLAWALMNLTEKNIVHGNIRCKKLMVQTHEANCFAVKLTDPGIHTTYASSEVHWIPIECYANLNYAKQSSEADVWSVGTTLWEIFTFGEEITPIEHTQAMRWYISGKRLPKPQSCPSEIYAIMESCWDMDPHKRIKPHAMMRDINQIMYQDYGPRQHIYETVLPKRPDIMPCRDSLTSVATESTVLVDFIAANDSDYSDGSSQSVGPDIYNDSNSYDFHNFMSTMSLPTATTSVDSLNSIFELDDYYDVVLQGKIGQGFYGEVYKGGYYDPMQNNELKRVAVKKLKANALISCMQDFEREINIMKSLDHPNIVKIVGVKRYPEIILVMEFVEHGSLQSYLNIYRESLEEAQLLKYASDIAKGMDYLGGKNIVHRDLAARNVLVVDKNHVKISDFGLAQVMGTNDYYIMRTTNRELPIKWYAPESIIDGKFSSRSDVWSYGVTMCEMFNYGEEPNLPNIDENMKNEPQQVILLDAIKKGIRFPCPPYCPKIVYARIIYPCWHEDSHSRPTFAQLITEIEDLYN